MLTPAPFERELTGAQRLPLPGLDGYRQFESERGWVITNDSAEAHNLIVAVRTAAARFEQIFGRPVFRGIIFFDVDEKKVPLTGIGGTELSKFMDSVGSRWNMPMTTSFLEGSVNFHQLQWEERERARLLRQRPTLTYAQWEDSITQGWAAEAEALFHEHSFERHEKGHSWTDNANLWPQGATGPRWLTEAVGILMEGPRGMRRRWDAAVETFKPDPSLMSLDALVDYPYECATAMIYFLHERTGDSTIFRSLIANDARGATMADWLRENGPRYRLPATAREFDEQWRQWFLARVAKEE